MVEVVRPKPALKARLSALRSCAKFLFGLGWVWALAFLISSHGQGAMHVLSFKRPRETVQKLLQRDMKALEKSDKNIKIAFLTRLLTIIGRKRWDKQRRALKYTASLAPSAGKRARVTFTQRVLRVGMFTLVQFDDMCSRSDHEKARNLLVDKYPKVWEADFRITKLHDEDGFEVGAMACPYGVAIACVKSSIEHQAYHKHTNTRNSWFVTSRMGAPIYTLWSGRLRRVSTKSKEYDYRGLAVKSFRVRSRVLAGTTISLSVGRQQGDGLCDWHRSSEKGCGRAKVVALFAQSRRANHVGRDTAREPRSNFSRLCDGSECGVGRAPYQHSRGGRLHAAFRPQTSFLLLWKRRPIGDLRWCRLLGGQGSPLPSGGSTDATF